MKLNIRLRLYPIEPIVNPNLVNYFRFGSKNVLTITIVKATTLEIEDTGDSRRSRHCTEQCDSSKQEFAIAYARAGTASCHLHRAIANAVESIVNSKEITDRSMKNLALNIIAIVRLNLDLWHDMSMRLAI
ncbi:hypothetical protein [Chamaesiphon sp. VAR_69_metabat_338]|uniref:hypothetical protein n=1 Tax=Chamaesiphon sp. VAR_69_metabat_338 TaxID=2964704 RepID=UPI00286D6E2A|nr:hypothetical protein [Chamaesiphon sp. VAR_69_metabat_338]